MPEMPGDSENIQGCKIMTTRWHMAPRPDWLRAELDKAVGYKDAEQRLAASLVLLWLEGELVDVARVARAMWTLGGMVMYGIDWSERQ